MTDYLPTDYPKLNCRKVNSAMGKIERKYNLGSHETWELFQKYAKQFSFETKMLGVRTKDTDIQTLTNEELEIVVKQVTEELEARKAC